MSTASGQPRTGQAGQPPSQPAGGGEAALRCVIWHAAAGELPGELLSSLSRRIGRMTVCTDALTAVAECCLIERDHRKAQAIGAPPVGGVLVLVHPRQLHEVPQVLDAVRMYAPCVAAWWYDRSANPKLRGVVEGDVKSWTTDTVQAPTMAQSAPLTATPAPAVTVVTQRLPAPASQNWPHGPHAHGGVHAVEGHQPVPPALRRGPLLTEDELAMLLSDEPIDFGSNRPGPASARGARGTGNGQGGTGS